MEVAAATGVKNPENIGLGCVANTLWILRCAQNDNPYFQLQYWRIGPRIETCLASAYDVEIVDYH